jgi:hypothetical protein
MRWIWKHSDWIVIPLAVWTMGHNPYQRPTLAPVDTDRLIALCDASGGDELTAHYEINDNRLQLKFDCETWEK